MSVSCLIVCRHGGLREGRLICCGALYDMIRCVDDQPTVPQNKDAGDNLQGNMSIHVKCMAFGESEACRVMVEYCSGQWAGIQQIKWRAE